MKAVDAWRKRDETVAAAGGTGVSAAATLSVAQRLAQVLESEREASSQRLQQQKMEAEKRLREV